MVKKILVRTFIALAVIVVVLGVVVAMQPSDFRIERSATIAAPVSEVFAEVNDFHKWAAWSAWDKVDPSMKRTYEGPTAGEGAMYKWAGNDEIGEGRMTLVESRPNELIRIKLEFFKPFEGKGEAEFTFKPQGDKTGVTWAMYGKNNFLAKAIHLCINMDKMIGDKYEQSLVALKSVVETTTAAK
jgi:uncharacterized protein YndB with AHSA1/START domain